LTCANLQFKDFPYPPGTAENIPHQELAGYLKSYSEHFELDKITSYNTRVEKAVKVLGTESTPPKWRLTLRKLESEGTDKAKETFWVQVGTGFGSVQSALTTYRTLTHWSSPLATITLPSFPTLRGLPSGQPNGLLVSCTRAATASQTHSPAR
jgi:hypothetical protein